MGIEYLAPGPARVDPHPWGLPGCIPAPWWTVNIGTIWRCDHCSQRWERVNSSQHEGRVWVEI